MPLDPIRNAVLGILAAFAAAAAPVDALSVSQLAQSERIVAAESGSPFPGQWQNDRMPHLVEVMDTCGLDHPSTECTIKASAQSGKSSVGENVLMHAIVQAPCPILVVLPSLDEAKKYDNTKLGPMIEATPALRSRVLEVVSRDEAGSTRMFKRFRGGYLAITTASSSKGLQGISARLRLFEECAEYPADVDGRGSPIDQANARGKAWTARGGKSIYISTPGLAGACEITARYDASDKRARYLPCPHCGEFQVLAFEWMRWDDDKAPTSAWFVCRAHGCIIEQHEQLPMLGRGVWIPTAAASPDDAPPPVIAPDAIETWRTRPVGGLQPGWEWWQAYSPLVPWLETAREYVAAVKKGPTALKVFYQQALARPWEERGDAPDAERLVERRESWPARHIPPGVLFLTGATDVQGNRLEWGVWGFDRSLSPHLVDFGTIDGDPSEDDVWHQHDELMVRSWPDAWGRRWPTARWGVDAGYLSSRVYTYVRRHAAGGKVMALDGRAGWRLPAIGTAKPVAFKVAGRKLTTTLYPVGTYDLKSEIYTKLRATLQGPDTDGRWPTGAVRLSDRVDLDFVKQLTAEYLVDRRERSGRVVKEWVRLPSRPNEQLDIAVYSLALAHHETDGMTDEQWSRLASERLGEIASVQLDMHGLWSPKLRDQALAPRMQPVARNMAPTVRRMRSTGVF